MLEMIMKLYYNIASTSNHTNILTSHHILLLSPLLPQMQMDTSHPILRLPPLLPKVQMNTTNNQVCKFYTTAINHFYKEAKALHSSEFINYHFFNCHLCLKLLDHAVIHANTSAQHSGKPIQ